MDHLTPLRDLALLLASAGLLGWLCQRSGVSSVVGYLFAGVFIGPHSPLASWDYLATHFPFVTDQARAAALAEIGLILLMFWIGLEFSLRKLRRLGLHLILANLAAALLIFNIARFAAHLAGLGQSAGVFLAGMVMISSSVVINKILNENGLAHERPAQQAMGLVIIEDGLVVALLTLLGSYIQIQTLSLPIVLSTLAVLGLFVALFFTLGIHYLPRCLTWLRQKTDADISTLLLCATLLGMSMLTVRAGYTLALGAFLFGAVIADTSARSQIQRTLSGTHSLFSALFFTSIGMQIDLSVLPSIWPHIIAFSFLTILVRSLSYTLGLLATGNPLAAALRTGLTVTPVGEFTFVIAGLGVSSGLTPPWFNALAIGMCLLTCLSAPFLTRHAESIAHWAELRQPRFLARFITLYAAWRENIAHRGRSNTFWQFTQKRLWQLLRDAAIVTAIAVFGRVFYRAFLPALGPDFFFLHGTRVLFALAILLLCLIPLVGLWRNLAALGLIWSEIMVPANSPDAPRRRRILYLLILSVGAIFMASWLLTLMPLNTLTFTSFAAILLAATLALLVFRHHFIRVQSRIEFSLHSAFSHDHASISHKLPALLQQHGLHDLDAVELDLPDDCLHAGQTLKKLDLRARCGVHVAGIERQGHLLANPSADTPLFSNDRLLILGSPDAIRRARAFLRQIQVGEETDAFDNLTLDTATVPENSPLAGRSLRDLRLPLALGIQITAIARADHVISTPSASEVLLSGDALMVLGNPRQLAELKALLKPDWHPLLP